MHNRLNSLFHIIIIGVIALSGFQLCTAGDDHYLGNDWVLLDPKPVIASAAQITPATYPNCDEVIIDEKILRVYHAEGTGECQDESFTKILTEKGKQDNDTLECYFILPYDSIEVSDLEIIKADGTVIPVNVTANSNESIDSSQMQENIYDPNSKVLQVNIPGLEVGDIIHSVIRSTILRPVMPGQYAESFQLEGDADVRHLSLEIHAPVDRPLKHIVLRDEIAKTVTYSTYPGTADTTVHHWEVNNVPPMIDEPAMPSEGQVAQRLLVSTIPDWQAVSQWYWELSTPHLQATTSEMEKNVNQIIAGATTDLDKVKALFYYVSNQIRYMGVTPEQDRPGLEPHDVKLTFEKKYGVCRDKAALLVSMLRMAGLEAYPVLTNVGDKLDQEVPSAFFNHAIVVAELKNGDDLLMDPTDENTLDLLPATEGNQSYLVCRPSGADLMTSPIVPAEQNLLRVSTTGVMNDLGHLEAKSELAFNGVNDNLFREVFAQMKPDEQRRFFEKALNSVMPGTHLTQLRLTPENMLDTSTPLRAEINFTVDHLAVFGGKKAIVNLPWISNRLGIVNNILRNAGLAQRKYPFETYVACGFVETFSLKLPDSFLKTLSIPSCAPIDDGCISYQRHFDFKDHTLEGSQELKLKVVEFTPPEYLKLKQTLRECNDDERKTPIFATTGQPSNMTTASATQNTKTTVESDARILEDQEQLQVKDAHSAVLKVHYAEQILSYAGKKREAELKIPYNPSDETVRLVSAAVISATGQRQEIGPGEIHTMDAEWNASANRYTGGKILVANLPGVEIGSTIEEEYEITFQGQPYLSGFESFQLSDELDRKSFRIIAPAEIKIQHRASGPKRIVKAIIKPAGPNREYSWEADHVAALPAETELLPDWAFLAGVEYFVGNPTAYLQELSQCLLERSNKSEKSGELARRLIQHAPTKLDALEAIRDYIAKSIRPAGPSFTELPLSELSDADTTLGDGYGHQADRAILFYAMLNAAGFKPEFVLASNLPPVAGIAKVARSFPLPDEFQVPLVRVIVGKETYYLNDTDEYDRLGTTPHNGKLAVVLPALTYETIRATNDCHDGTTTIYSVSLTADGKTRIGIKRQYYGTVFGEKNHFFAELTPEKKDLYYQEAVSAVAQGARPAGDLTANFNTYPGIEQFTVEIDHYAVIADKFCYFNLPFVPRLLPATANQRALPLFISQSSTQQFRVEIELPPAYPQVDIAPGNEQFNEPDGTGTVRVATAKANDQLIISFELNSRPAIVTPADYPAAENIEAILENPVSRVLLLESL